MLIGYAYTYSKTSAGNQDLSRQRSALTAAGCTSIYEDRLTMGNPRPKRKRVFDELREGDTLVVTQLDRLADPHGKHELTMIASLLSERKVGLRSLTEAWADANNIITNYLDYQKYQKDPLTLKPIYEEFVRIVLESGDDYKIDYPWCLTFGYQGGSSIERWGIGNNHLLEMFLYFQDKEGFSYEKSKNFCEKLRKIGRWYELKPSLDEWFQRAHEKFIVGEVDNNITKFACYIAICNIKYGASWDYLTAEEIFRKMTALGSKLPSQLKQYGSGELPKAITDYKDEDLTFKANDAFATIRMAIKIESEENYRKILDHLADVLEAEFPRSYAIEFRSPNKMFLPIGGLPKKGVNQLFANAAIYPALWPLIERYARLAMREFEWYSNSPEENPVMPGTFAVFALTLADKSYGGLALDYLRICDGEHQSAHANLVHAYIAKYGFTRDAIRLLIASAENIQHMTARKIYPALIANKNSLALLVQARKGEMSETLVEEPRKSTLWARDPDRAWRNVLATIWGDAAIDRPDEIVEVAPEELRSQYRTILGMDRDISA